ncbi:MAG: glycosyltransferase family 4 protein [Rhizobiales bacterium]|nr:glycosyltransferase family 4 protein [Hyphomicrobiales bacterium]MBI3673095.1 glycosyltransferase family 4 protein [Hyphomicrobiales bacterium]
MRILHVFRAPVGGLFRHVRDQARGQTARGHEVGILCDSTTGGETADRLLAAAAPFCSLGVTRIPISRLPGLGDISAIRQTTAHADRLRPDIIHCHGAKGGLYGRIAGRRLAIATVYSPHGGSLHYRWTSPAGVIVLVTEWCLARIGSGLHFVCNYERECFNARIGIGSIRHAIIHNGLWPEEFAGVAPSPDARDILFIGDMRLLKGVDVLLEALARCRLTACLVGDGPDLDRFKALSHSLGLDDLVTFAGRLSATEAFGRGRILVMPSRHESFPYVILEAAAAGLPILASDVGGIPEILPADRLVPAGDVEALANAMRAGPGADRRVVLGDRFTADAMVERMLDFYRRLLTRDGALH